MMYRIPLAALTLAGLLMTPALAGAETTLSATKGAVQATTDGQVAWSHQVVDADLGDPIPTAVTARAGTSYALYCARGMLYETSLEAGVVLQRFLLPGECLGLTASPDGVVSIDLKGDGISQHAWEETITHTVGERDLDVRGPERVLGMLLTKNQARRALPDAVSSARVDAADFHAHADALAARYREQAEPLERSLQRLGELAAQDPTNAWFVHTQARIHWHLGRQAQARALWERLLSAPPSPHDGELLGMVVELETIDADLAQRFFERAFTAMLASGYEPELARGLIHLMVTLGRPEEPFDMTSAEGLDAAKRHADRVLAVAPRAEGVGLMITGLAQGLEDAGRHDEAAAYRELARDETLFGLLGAESADIPWAMHGLNFYTGLWLAFVLLMFVKLARDFSASWADPDAVPKITRYNPFSRVSRGELAGLLGLLVLGGYILKRIAAGVALIGIVASGPVSAVSGYVTSPEARSWLEPTAHTPEGALLLGIGDQQAGDLDAALARYEAAGSALAWNNIGVIRHQRGDAAGAAQAWEQALTLEPGLESARYNLGQGTSGARSARLARYLPGRKLLAVPRPAEYAALWDTMTRASDVSEASVFEIAGAVDTISATDDGAPAAMLPIASSAALVVWMLFALLMVLGLVTPRGSTRVAPTRGTIGWALGLAIPGGSRRLGFVGPFVTAGFFGLAISAYMVSRNDGFTSSILKAIALPSFQRYFGIGAGEVVMPDVVDQTIMAWASYWWLILALGIALNVALERALPDDAGPIARRG
jgi:tetratricopeptide (TPR) repeat protein